ncbi:MAG: hypothetical protein CFE36_14360 [Sphingomonadaceae bacterium PASS1]|nr:MAG: hypothetical protein CFE36_14360 [Sphingomonadaceae bacterium PASS1]
MNKHIFIVESFTATTHTFIREDVLRHDSSNIIDISKIEIQKIRDFGISQLYILKRIIKIILCNPLDIAKLLFSIRFLQNAKALYLWSRIDEIHNLGPGDLLSCHFVAKCAVIGFLARCQTGCQLRIICHASDLYTLPRGMNIILQNATILEPVTWFAKGFIFGRIGSAALGKAIMRRNGVAEMAAPKDEINNTLVPSATLRLLTACRLVNQKDIHFAIMVVNQLKASGFSVLFEVIGSGPLYASLVRDVEGLNLNNEVTFVGERDNDYVRQAMRRSDAFLLPCEELNLDHADGLPVVFQEALSEGCPIFCRRAFGVAELIINGINGWAFEGSDDEAVWAKVISSQVKGFDRALIRNVANHQR